MILNCRHDEESEVINDRLGAGCLKQATLLLPVVGIEFFLVEHDEDDDAGKVDGTMRIRA